MPGEPRAHAGRDRQQQRSPQRAVVRDLRERALERTMASIHSNAPKPTSPCSRQHLYEVVMRVFEGPPAHTEQVQILTAVEAASTVVDADAEDRCFLEHSSTARAITIRSSIERGRGVRTEVLEIAVRQSLRGSELRQHLSRPGVARAHGARRPSDGCGHGDHSHHQRDARACHPQARSHDTSSDPVITRLVPAVLRRPMPATPASSRADAAAFKSVCTLTRIPINSCGSVCSP